MGITNPTAFRRNFSEDALNKNGYTLLNYMTLRATFDVYQQVIAPDTATLSGDYNGNGIVDADDYTVWRDTFGQIGSGLDADGTGMNGTPTVSSISSTTISGKLTSGRRQPSAVEQMPTAPPCPSRSRCCCS